MRIFVVGYPSDLGGADTELWHVLKLWRQRQWDVTLIPTWQADPAWRDRCRTIGVPTAEVGSADNLAEITGLRGGLVVSFCNGQFLQTADRFRELDCRIVWAGCMTWLFEAERRHYEQYGPFDGYVFQSEFQKELLLPGLREYGVRDEQCFVIRGALDVGEFPFVPRLRPRNSTFTIGRLARPDPDKWSAETWAILGAVRDPARRARLMGWNDRIEEKLGRPPAWAEVLPACAEAPHTFLASLHCMMSINGGAAENWPRIGLEAMSTGVPVIADNRWGWREMIVHGETGFLAEDAGAFADYATLFAADEGARQRIIATARERLCDELANPARILDQWQRLLAQVEGDIRSPASHRPARRIVIGVASSCDYEERRERCRQTWVGDAAGHAALDVVFLVGDPTRSVPERHGDMLYLPCPDDYDHLPQKTLWFCRWALQHAEFDYLFKCDDDTYVAIRRFVSYSGQGDYIGCDIGGYASGGAGYLLSRRAAATVAEQLVEPTGAEDLLTGRVLRQAGIFLTADSRFGSWPRPDQVPRRDNRMITGHGWRDDQMLEIHDALCDAAPRRPRAKHCRIEDATVAWGELGLDGKRGHDVDGTDDVDLPADILGDDAWDVLSAHAPSRLVVFVPHPCTVIGALDGGSWPNPERPTRLRVDGALVGELGQPYAKTVAVALSPGRHELVAECDGPITRRYPVWLMRPSLPTPPRIVMPTSDHYDLAATTSLALLARYWPEHPPVDIVGYARFPRAATPDKTRLIPVGIQSDVAWTTAFAAYLRSHCPDEFLLLWLDDYALFAAPDHARLRRAMRVLSSDPTVASFHLTSMQLPSQPSYSGGGDAAGIVCYPPWTYSVNLQAALWRKTSLLRLLDAVGPASAGDFELAASRHYNAHLETFEKHLGYASAGAMPLFLDADPGKHRWVLPYHNLMHAGNVDPRHCGFLENQGLGELADRYNADQVGLAFNGDYHMLAEFRRLIHDFAIRTIIETGTYLGHTTALLATLAEQVVSVEADRALYEQARARVAHLHNVRLLVGDSAQVLAGLLASAAEPYMVYLDAHSAAGTPLLAELDAVACTGCRPVIAIHDMCVPGSEFGFDSYAGQDYRWEWIEPSIRRIFGPDGYRYFFNRRAAGAKRGVVYVVPRL